MYSVVLYPRVISRHLLSTWRQFQPRLQVHQCCSTYSPCTCFLDFHVGVYRPLPWQPSNTLKTCLALSMHTADVPEGSQSASNKPVPQLANVENQTIGWSSQPYFNIIHRNAAFQRQPGLPHPVHTCPQTSGLRMPNSDGSVDSTQDNSLVGKGQQACLSRRGVPVVRDEESTCACAEPDSASLPGHHSL